MSAAPWTEGVVAMTAPDAARVDIVCVRHPDYSNEYHCFVDGSEAGQGEMYGCFTNLSSPRTQVHIEIWDVDLGRDDLSNEAEWRDWLREWDEDDSTTEAVRSFIAEIEDTEGAEHGFTR